MARLVINLARELELINFSSELHFALGLIRPIFHFEEHDWLSSLFRKRTLMEQTYKHHKFYLNY